jgi:hypothetical protein
VIIESPAWPANGHCRRGLARHRAGKGIEARRVQALASSAFGAADRVLRHCLGADACQG